MKAILVRVGIDHSYGGWNAPVDPDSMRFVYIPIPQKKGSRFLPGQARSYREIVPSLLNFCKTFDLSLELNCKFPSSLLHRYMHLDPEFQHLTYGDRGDRRGAGIAKLQRGDILAFYAGLRPIRPCQHKLLYALVGIYIVKEVVLATEIPHERRQENAHTRTVRVGKADIVVRARRGQSGRLTHCIPIGEWRDRAYRVRKDLLDRWGGLSVKEGYIQRSAQPPSFLKPERFYRWLKCQGLELVAKNN